MSERVLFVHENAQITLVHRYFQLSIINAKDRYQIISQVYHIFRMMFQLCKMLLYKNKKYKRYIENIYERFVMSFGMESFF